MFKRIGKNGMHFFMLFLLVLQPFLNSLSVVAHAGSNQVKLNALPTPPVDVIVTHGDSEFDLSTFEDDLSSELIKRQVDPDLLNLQAFNTLTISTKEQNAEDIFKSWDSRTILPSNGSSSVTPTQLYIGNHVTGGWEAKGNRVSADSSSGRPAKAWVNPDNAAYETKNASISFTWGIDEENYGSFTHGESGFIFGMEDDRNFYLYIMDNHVLCGNLRIDGGEAILKIKDGQIIIMDAKEGFPMYTPGVKHDVDIQIQGNTIKVHRNGNLVLDVVDEEKEQIKGSYGFYVWDQYGAYFSDITIESKEVRAFSEVIREPEWTDGSNRFLVNVEDFEVTDFNDSHKSGEILTRLMNEEIHYVGIGGEYNKSQIEEFVERNDNNGLFINGENYNEAISQLADYITSVVSEGVESGTGSEHILLGEHYDFQVSPNHLKDNTETTLYPDGRWSFIHDATYYENDFGVDELSGIYTPDLKDLFDKPGRYEFFFEDANTEPRYIYVHRRPIANFSMEVVQNQSRDNYNVTITDLSYDPDRESTPNKGIVETKWRWKRVSDVEWNEGMIPNTIPAGVEYIIQLQVKDAENAWSNMETRYITTSNVITHPVANFLMPTSGTVYQDVDIQQLSYDPSGQSITEEKWTVHKGSQVIYEGNKPLTNFSEHGKGNYRVELKVKNSHGLWSEAYTRHIYIGVDELEPEIIVNPDKRTWNEENVLIQLEFEDYGGSGFDGYRYAISDNKNLSDIESKSWKKDTTATISLEQDGSHYLFVEAKDGEGNVASEVFGPYQVDKTAPVIKLAPSTTKPTNKDVTVDVNVSDNASGVKDVRYAEGEHDSSWMKKNGKAVSSNKFIVTENGTFTVYASDHTGHETIKNITVSNIDKTPPAKATFIASYESITNQDVFVEIHYPNDAYIKEYRVNGGEWSSYNEAIIFTENGELEARSRDEAGNYSEIAKYTVSNIDKTPPKKATFTPSETNWVNKKVIVDIEYPEDAHIKQYRKDGGSWSSYDSSITFTQNGKLEARSKDEAGNWSDISVYNVTNIDKEKPTLQLKPSTIEWTNKDVMVSVTAKDKSSGVKEVKWTKGERDASWFENNGTKLSDDHFIATNNGKYTVYVVDYAGNETVQNITISNIDKTPPMITLELSTTQPTNKDVSITVKLGTSTSGIKEVLWDNGKRDAAWFNNNGRKLNGSSFIVSKNDTYTVYAEDYAENKTVHHVAVLNIDKEPPVAPKLTPSEISLTNKDVYVSIEYPEDAHKKEFRMNGVWEDYKDAIRFTMNGVVEARAIDQAGNISKIARYEVNNIDKVAPERPILLVSESENTFNLIEGKDVGFGSSHSEYRINGNAWELFEGTVVLPDGEYVFEARTIDLAGNNSVISSVNATFYGEMIKEIEDIFDDFEDFYDESDLEEIRDIIDELPENAEERNEYENRYENGRRIALGYCVEDMTTEECRVWKLIQLIDGYDRFSSGLKAVEKRFEDVPEEANYYSMLLNNIERLRGNINDFYENRASTMNEKNALQRVIDVENRYSAFRVELARTAIKNVEDAELKNYLFNRLEFAIELYQEMKTQDLVKDAQSKVLAAEQNPTTVNKILAQNAINNLPDGEDKEKLQQRLDMLQKTDEEGPTKEELLQKQIEYATTLVIKAEENYTTVNRILAENAVNELPDGKAKDELLQRLELLANPSSNEDEIALNNAKKAMENAERYKTKRYVENAHNAIYALEDIEEKEELLNRLNQLKEELGLDDKGLYEKAIKEIERHLRSPRITIYKNRALDAIAEVINEEYRAELEAYMNGDITRDELLFLSDKEE